MNYKQSNMDNVRRTDVGYTYWTVSKLREYESLDDVIYYIQKHGYSAGDGSTFIIMSVHLLPPSYPSYILPEYGDPLEIALSHTILLKGRNYTMIDFSLDIVDMTKYRIDKEGRVVIGETDLGIDPIEAAMMKGVQYNRGSPIDTFRKLTSFILSRYDIDRYGTIVCPTTDKYSVRSVQDIQNIIVLKGIILYER